ncbi:hypothetical protein [Thiohalophilus sp.]|uniref:hypothetical protein n=1 Tax=Thiohalophilus sp. TaxID=3028392 RepID=UPI002ACDF0A9|nr:hypothetical protein [Thiohalophilus sp.]MDZ7804317.1 hypothetical protein [Thiohalophilus sp.]
MQFERMSKYHKESSEGYVIAASRVNGGWVFSASGPKRPSIRNGNTINALKDPLRGLIPFRESYDIGDMRYPRAASCSAATAKTSAAASMPRRRKPRPHAFSTSRKCCSTWPNSNQPATPNSCGSSLVKRHASRRTRDIWLVTWRESLPNSDRPGDVVVAQSGGAR